MTRDIVGRFVYSCVRATRYSLSRLDPVRGLLLWNGYPHRHDDGQFMLFVLFAVCIPEPPLLQPNTFPVRVCVSI